MYIRAVRFTGVAPERMDAMLARIDGAGGPPPGVTASGLKVLYDADQSSAVVLQEFDTAGDMETAARIFDAMDSGDTPGTRVSVDACEVKLVLTP